MFFKALFNSFKSPQNSATTFYSSLPYSERISETSEDVPTSFIHNEKTSPLTPLHAWLWIAQGTLFLCSVTLLVIGYKRPLQDAECVKQIFTYSPAFEAVEYHEEDYKGIFHQASAYRGKPTPELDERWRKLWDYGTFNVPYDKLHLLNRSTELTWERTPEEYGGGAAALLWGYHQLHCLDTIRQATWLDVYRNEYNMTPEGLDGPDYLVRMHVDHCLELLRIDMMCNIDVTPYLVLIDSTAPLGVRADFSSHHKCRNWEEIQEWMIDHAAKA